MPPSLAADVGASAHTKRVSERYVRRPSAISARCHSAVRGGRPRLGDGRAQGIWEKLVVIN